MFPAHKAGKNSCSGELSMKNFLLPRDLDSPSRLYHEDFVNGFN